MSEIKSSHPSIAWFSAGNGEGAELDKLTQICAFTEQSVNIICGRLKYIHANFGFYNNRKISQTNKTDFRNFNGDV